jgi:hypothetical protein
MSWYKDTLDYLKAMRIMGKGIWQSRLFFVSLFILSLSISAAIILLANNSSLQQLRGIINV